jgi:hypothetical protein
MQPGSTFLILRFLRATKSTRRQTARMPGSGSGDLTHLPKSKDARETFSTGDSFAAITLIEVAEHLTSPRVPHLPQPIACSKRGGVLVIQTANFEGWQAVKGGADYHYYLPGPPRLLHGDRPESRCSLKSRLS